MADGPDFLVFCPDEALDMVIDRYDRTGVMEPFTLGLKLVRANDPNDAEDDGEDLGYSNEPDYDGRAYGRFKGS